MSKYHYARVEPRESFHEPMQFVENKFGEGIDAVWGMRKSDGSLALQAIRFSKSVHNANDVRMWLKSRNVNAEFEAKDDRLEKALDVKAFRAVRKRYPHMHVDSSEFRAKVLAFRQTLVKSMNSKHMRTKYALVLHKD